MNAMILLGSMFALLLFGIPIAYAIGLSSALLLVATGMRPLVLIPQRMFIGMDAFVLIAIPLFTMAGFLMDRGGLSRRLVDCIEKWFGRIPGGLGTVTILCCTVFAALTGSGPATVAAIGAVVLPGLLDKGYSRKEAAGLLAAGGALGPIIPPSICMIVYGTTMNLDIIRMFMGALVPGLIIAAAFIVVNACIRGRRVKEKPPRFTLREKLASLKHGVGVLVIPVLVLGGIYGGFFTPTEAAVVCVVYSIILGFVYRELSCKDVVDAMKRTVEPSAVILAIVSISNLFGWLMSASKIPTGIVEAVVPYLTSPNLYLVILLLVLFIAGCLMETVVSIVIFAPILVPIGIHLGLDPLHLGVVFCICLVVGFITPPFGVNLFASSVATGVSFTDVTRGVVPYMIVSGVCVAVFAFVPQIILWLPAWLAKG